MQEQNSGSNKFTRNKQQEEQNLNVKTWSVSAWNIVFEMEGDFKMRGTQGAGGKSEIWNSRQTPHSVHPSCPTEWTRYNGTTAQDWDAHNGTQFNPHQFTRYKGPDVWMPAICGVQSTSPSSQRLVTMRQVEAEIWRGSLPPCRARCAPPCIWRALCSLLSSERAEFSYKIVVLMIYYL